MFICDPFDEFPALSAELDDLDEESERQLLLANLDMVLAERMSRDEWASAAARRSLGLPLDPYHPIDTLTPREVYL